LPLQVNGKGKTEVQYFHLTVAVHFDIGRLQITMDDAPAVRGLKRFCNLPDQMNGLADGKSAPPQSVRQRRAKDILEHQKLGAGGFIHAMDGRDMRGASRAKRLIPSSSSNSGRMNLSATERSSLVSVARYTTPIPPTSRRSSTATQQTIWCVCPAAAELARNGWSQLTFLLNHQEGLPTYSFKQSLPALALDLDWVSAR